jgi:hypothetical protein
MPITRHTSHVTRQTSHVKSHTSHVKRHTSNVKRHTSHVTRHTSHVTRHTSHVTCHTSHVTRHTSLATWRCGCGIRCDVGHERGACGSSEGHVSNLHRDKRQFTHKASHDTIQSSHVTGGRQNTTCTGAGLSPNTAYTLVPLECRPHRSTSTCTPSLLIMRDMSPKLASDETSRQCSKLPSICFLLCPSSLAS